MQPSDYGQRLESAMRARSIDREKLSAHLGVSVQAIGQVITGKTKALNALNHSVACQILGCDPVWLASGRGNPFEEAAEGEQQSVQHLITHGRLLTPMEAVIGVGKLLQGLSGYRRISASSIIQELIDRPESAAEAAVEIERLAAAEPEFFRKRHGT